MNLPKFRYHPDPLASGAVEQKAGTCVCCERPVEFIYVATTYSTHDLRGKLCPWCIADGSAYATFAVEFSDPWALAAAGIAAPVIEEVAQRTPGYVSWQTEEWLSHCDDACAFLGDAKPDTLRKMTAEEMAPLIEAFGLDETWFREYAEEYESIGDPAIYHFKCLHCGIQRFGMDCG